MAIEIIEDSHLRIKGLSKEWILGLSKLCSVKNEEKEVAIKEEVWGAEKLDDLLTLAEVQDDTLILPRGFKNELSEMLNSTGYEHTFIKQYIDKDRITGTGPFIKDFPPAKDRDQERAVAKLKVYDMGRFILPPGKGKTVIGLFGIASLDRQSLIIVDKKHIAQQWINNAYELFNEWELGFIGDQKWKEGPHTVALIQTLVSKEKELDEQNWWDKWEFILLDEQHHIPADTYTRILSKFKARKRFGLSATVGKTEAKKRISELIFGPILYESKSIDVPPVIKIVETNFDYAYHTTHKVKEHGKVKLIRNNYQPMMKKLVNSPYRNAVIAQNIIDDPEGTHLVVSNRKDHLKAIRGIAENNGIKRCFNLTGDENLDQRMEIYAEAGNGSCAIFSTFGIAGEALDIPRLDRIHLAYPIKNEETVWQIIGRGIRTHEDKDCCIIFDYVDSVGVLYNQYTHRLRKLYQPKKLKVEKLTGQINSNLLKT